MPPDADDDRDIFDDLEDEQNSFTESDELLSKYLERLPDIELTTRMIGSAEDREQRAALADKMNQVTKRIKDDSVWEVEQLSDEEAAWVQEVDPQLFEQIDVKRKEFADRQAAIDAQRKDEEEFTAKSAEEQATALAEAEDKADLDRRRIQLEEFLDYPGVEAIDPLSGQVTKVPMVERKHPITGQPDVVFGVPEHLEQVTATYKQWVSLPGHKRGEFLSSLPEVMQDALSVVYGVAPPLDLDELPAVKEL